MQLVNLGAETAIQLESQPDRGTRTHQQTDDQPGQQIANSRELQSASSSAAVTALCSSEPRSIEMHSPTSPFGLKGAHGKLAVPNDCARTSLPREAGAHPCILPLFAETPAGLAELEKR